MLLTKPLYAAIACAASRKRLPHTEVPHARCRIRFIFYFLFFIFLFFIFLFFIFLFFYLAHAYAAEEALDRNGRASILAHIAQKASHSIGFAVPPVVAGVAGVQGTIVAGVGVEAL
jgi:heme/copper-type cytochrome/quinol oxidase subunit 2